MANIGDGERRYLEFQLGRSSDFYSALFRAIGRADSDNLDKLAGAFPDEVAAYRAWCSGDLTIRKELFGE